MAPRYCPLKIQMRVCVLGTLASLGFSSSHVCMPAWGQHWHRAVDKDVCPSPAGWLSDKGPPYGGMYVVCMETSARFNWFSSPLSDSVFERHFEGHATDSPILLDHLWLDRWASLEPKMRRACNLTQIPRRGLVVALAGASARRQVRTLPLGRQSTPLPP